MARIVIRDDAVITGRDAASVWAEVGDLNRIDEWLPVHRLAGLEGADPAVGNVVFVSHRPDRDPERAIRLDVVEWGAGSYYRCRARPVPGIDGASLLVRVVGEAPDDAAHCYLEFTGDVTGWLGRLAAWDIKRRLRLALERLRPG